MSCDDKLTFYGISFAVLLILEVISFVLNAWNRRLALEIELEKAKGEK